MPQKKYFVLKKTVPVTESKLNLKPSTMPNKNITQFNIWSFSFVLTMFFDHTVVLRHGNEYECFYHWFIFLFKQSKRDRAQCNVDTITALTATRHPAKGEGTRALEGSSIYRLCERGNLHLLMSSEIQVAYKWNTAVTMVASSGVPIQEMTLIRTWNPLI